MLHSFDSTYFKALTPFVPGEATDENLMERIQEGDEEAFATLFRRHHALLSAIISRMVYNNHEIEDIMQESLLHVWRNAANYNAGKGHALGWIVTIVRRRTIDRIRRKSAYLRAQDKFSDDATSFDKSEPAGVDEEAAENDRAAVVSRLIAKLPEAQQEVVNLTFYQGMSQRQIAAHTGIPLGTIKTRLQLACSKLRSSMLAIRELHEPMLAAA